MDVGDLKDALDRYPETYEVLIDAGHYGFLPVRDVYAERLYGDEPLRLTIAPDLDAES